MSTAKTNKLIEQRLQELYPELDLNQLSIKTNDLKMQLQLVEQVSADTQKAIDKTAHEAMQKLMTIITGGNQELTDAVNSGSRTLNTIIVGGQKNLDSEYAKNITNLEDMKKSTETFLIGIEKKYEEYILGLIENEGKDLLDEFETKQQSTESFMRGLQVELDNHVKDQMSSIDTMKKDLEALVKNHRSSVDTMSAGTISLITERFENLSEKLTTIESKYDSLVTFLKELSHLEVDKKK